MRMRKLAPTVGALATAVLVSWGCAGTAEYPSATPEGDAVIVVDNTGTLNSEATIHLIPNHGTRRRLGTVRLNERRTFRVSSNLLTGNYRLLADPLGERDMVSHEFTLARGDQIEWDLHMNQVHFSGNRSHR